MVTCLTNGNWLVFNQFRLGDVTKILVGLNMAYALGGPIYIGWDNQSTLIVMEFYQLLWLGDRKPVESTCNPVLGGKYSSLESGEPLNLHICTAR